MSDILESAVEALKEKLPAGFDGTVKFEIEGVGAILIGENGVEIGDGPADVTLKADADTFKEILSGDLNPTAAFMSGRLQLDGDMSTAMRLGSALV